MKQFDEKVNLLSKLILNHELKSFIVFMLNKTHVNYKIDK